MSDATRQLIRERDRAKQDRDDLRDGARQAFDYLKVFMDRLERQKVLWIDADLLLAYQTLRGALSLTRAEPWPSEDYLEDPPEEPSFEEITQDAIRDDHMRDPGLSVSSEGKP